MSQKTKYLLIKFENKDKFKVPAHVIAKDRTGWYRNKAVRNQEPWSNVEERNTFEDSMRDHAIMEWAHNSMNWKDLQSNAIKLPMGSDLAYDYEKNWPSAEFHIIEE